MKKFKLLALLLTCGAFWGTNCCAKSAAAKERYKAARDMLTVVESESFDPNKNVAAFKRNVGNLDDVVDSFKHNIRCEGEYAIKARGKGYKLNVKYEIFWFLRKNIGLVSILYNKVPNANNSKALVKAGATGAAEQNGSAVQSSSAAIIIPNPEKAGYLFVVEKEFWGDDDLENYKSNAIGAIRKTFREQILPVITQNNNGNNIKSITDKQEEPLIDLSAL